MVTREERIAIFQDAQRLIAENTILKKSVAESISNQEIISEEDSVNYTVKKDKAVQIIPYREKRQETEAYKRLRWTFTLTEKRAPTIVSKD